MAERSSDIPNFDTYPAAPPERLLPVEGTETSVHHGRSGLEQRAADLGAAAGRVVASIRQVQARLTNLPTAQISDRVNDLTDNVKTKASGLAENVKTRADELRQRATTRAQEYAQAASEMSVKLGEQAREGLQRARVRARVAARDYPVHVALAAGAAGFLIGIGLRLRRASRAY